MINVEDKLPQPGQIVIAYFDNGNFIISRFTKVLTWKGRRLKFVNMASKGLWSDNVVGWNRLPTMDETI